MRTAASVLQVIRERGRRGLPLEDVYRQLFNPDLYLTAYGHIAANQGALTPGITDETADAMSLKKIQAMIEALRSERYRWTPVRRIYIEKKHSTKKRPLGVPTWTDKLLQEVVRLILEAYYEPQFSDRSHGFRPQRGGATALRTMYRWWRGTTWFIEGDITACFDSLDHEVLLSILRERVRDNRFLRLIANLLKAGYLEEWHYRPSPSGSPQGGIVSPLLANIYLDRWDHYITDILIPAHTRGLARKTNPAWIRAQTNRRRAARAGHREQAHELQKLMRSLPSMDTHDPAYRRLRYLRYADDFLLGFTGPYAEAEAIKQAIGTFLRESLKLELSPPKTLITHGRSEAARFLGYEVQVLQADRKITNGQRCLNGAIGLKVPEARVQELCRRYMDHGIPMHRKELTNNAVFSIVDQYEAEFRGYVEYYRLAYNLHRLNRLKWVMETSLVKTLAAKLRLHVSEVYRRYRATYQGRKVLRVEVEREGKRPVVALWGRTDLKRDIRATLDDAPFHPVIGHTELVQRLLADTCELCGSQEAIEVHHIRALRDLKRPGRKERPLWMQVMAARRRKTLVLCRVCHRGVAHSRPRRRLTEWRATGEPDDAKVSRPVRREADGKVPMHA